MPLFKLKPLTTVILSFFFTSTALQTAWADDTEIYVPKDVPADQQVRPNILFVLDSSGSMGSTVNGTNPRQTRIQVLHAVVKNLITDLSAQRNVNIGIMEYYWSGQRGILRQQITHATPENKNHSLEIVGTIEDNGNTPLQETYYSAYQYLYGEPVNYSFSTKRQDNGSRITRAPSKNFGTPIQHSCQKTHIIYVTDGAPTSDGYKAQIQQLARHNKVFTDKNCGNGGQARCMRALSEYMANNNMGEKGTFPNPTGRIQTVTSHFIGFALDLPFLREAAEVSGGKYYSSNNVSGLTEALKSIVVDITAENTSFAAPSVAVSAYNNLNFRNELYYALFRPAEGANWIGNVKKYKLITRDDKGQSLASPMIVGEDGKAAVDDTTGFFKDSAKSFWSTEVDGSDVGRGGFAQQLTPAARTIYTWTGSDLKLDSSSTTSLEKLVNKGSLAPAITNKISYTQLGAANENHKNSILRWIHGYNKTNGTARNTIGDVLHNEPRLVAYTTDESPNNDGTKEQLVMFFGTNEGFLHAVDPKDGKEHFAFLPKELLSVPAKYHDNYQGFGRKAYGLDGFISVWTEYSALSTKKTRTAQKVNLYAGMRRGGSNYYALDVLDYKTPKLKWVIKGAYNPEDEISKGFESLGLTFSAPKLADININGKKTKVLIFTGGYDKLHDETSTSKPKDDELGNALYIVDADSGKLLWRAEKHNRGNLQIREMTNSMPASPTLIDSNSDGLIDIIYVSDLRGQIFRFDINNANSSATPDINGRLFASLAGTTINDNRRFFNSPDVALIRDQGQKPYYTVSIGSGFRESPLHDQIDDRFYVLRDPNTAANSNTSSTVITESTLTDVSGLENNTQKAKEAYARIAGYEDEINRLNQAVRDAEAAFEQLKEQTGYNKVYEEYLANTQLVDQLQADIDKRLDDHYKDIEKTNYKNQLFFDQHAEETHTQAVLLEQALEWQNTLKALNQGSNVDKILAQELAKRLSAIVTLHNDTEQNNQTILEHENFLLIHQNDPELTNALRSEINQRYPSIDLSDPAVGDFLDIANQVEAEINKMHDDFKQSTNTQKRTDIARNSHDIKNKLNEITQARQNGENTDKLLSELDTLLGVAPDNTADIQNLLNNNLAQQNTEMTDLARAFNALQNDIRANEALIVQAQATASDAQKRAEQIALQNHFDIAFNKIEETLEKAGNPNQGIPNLRQKINEEYANLNLTDNTLTESQLEDLKRSKGFFLRLTRGEKVLADSVSFRGNVLFSTFRPTGGAIDVCGSDVGRGRTYALSLRDSTGALSKLVNGVETPVRYVELNKNGIPPSPTVVIGEDGSIILTGTEIISSGENNQPVRATYWREQ
ncbi:PilC/PilY family type IV pilus protein [Pseudomonas sp. F1_0610]|uniref:PilC/PilY family type IV pilus protein n=1 Tax=Pseudomonas sp. F1_0610 TaxID=3114284 RepID=UPI0039C26EB9